VSELVVRPYSAGDRRALRETCVATAWLGAPAPEKIPDGLLWADLFTRYFTDREPEHIWVVEGTADLKISGYLTGTQDVGRVERYLLRSLPRLLARLATSAAVRDANKRNILRAMFGSLLKGELVPPLKVRAEFPARFQLSLGEEARGRGIGPLLLHPFLTRLSALGVRGVHTQTLSLNEAAFRFLRRGGFQLVASWPLSAFAETEARKIDLLTWVRPL
jgi:GNAT superfamily N-acetyltransferase